MEPQPSRVYIWSPQKNTSSRHHHPNRDSEEEVDEEDHFGKDEIFGEIWCFHGAQTMVCHDALAPPFDTTNDDGVMGRYSQPSMP